MGDDIGILGLVLVVLKLIEMMVYCVFITVEAIAQIVEAFADVIAEAVSAFRK